jgi:solute carrier family 25 carnitine/acylcarnitine transporter 20/29
LVGTTAPLFYISFTRIATFSVYQWAKYVVDAAIEKSTGKSPLIMVNTPLLYPDMATIGCFTAAGAITGATLTAVVGMSPG